MSYILDALKKSEQQRDRGRIPTLTDAAPVSATGSGRKNLPVIGALLLAMLAVLLALYAVLNGHFMGSPEPMENPQAASTGSNTKPPETPEQKKAVSAPATVNLPTISESGKAAEESQQPLKTTPPTSRTEKTVAAEASQPKTIPVAVPPEETVTKTPSAAPSNDRPSLPEIRSEQPVPMESVATETPEPPSVVTRPPPPEKTASNDSVIGRSTTLQTTPEVKDAVAAKRSRVVTPKSQPPVKKVRKKRPGTEHTLPYDVYRRLPKRKVSALAYSEAPERRFVIVNSRKMREKESTEQGLEVVEIMDDGVIFSFQGHPFFKQLIP